jgi:lipoyl(octanoyl) transferase
VPTITKKIPLRIIDCGLADYRRILDLQLKLQEQRRNSQIPDTILVVEHYPVITLGAHKTANRLTADEELIKSKNIDIVETRRGGGITAHNPGQLVYYPILNLQQLNLSISNFIKKLEKVGIELLGQLSVQSQNIKGLPGLWIITRDTKHQIPDTKKIASIGVRVSRFITCHGMAININNDLSIFDLFVPCGLDGVKMTSVFKETGKKFPMVIVKQILSQILQEQFSLET